MIRLEQEKSVKNMNVKELKDMCDIQGDVPVLSLDSKIEHIFYKKCMEDSALTLILLEWANSKKIYCSHTKMTVFTHTNYSRHDSSHSVSILGSIWAIIGKERIENMSVMDLWLLLHCAYGHDIGMPYSYNEAVKLWESVKEKDSDFRMFLEECKTSDDEDIRQAIRYIESITEKIIPEKDKDEKEQNKEIVEKFSYSWPAEFNKYYMYLTAEFCRQQHTHRSREVIREKFIQEKASSPYNLEDRLYNLVGICAEMHGKSFEDLLKLPKKEFTPVGDCHPPFIAALLRLGDLLDIDNKRFDMVALSYYGDVNKLSEIHRKKHESITHIDYEINKIEIRAESDDEEVCRCASEWFQYLDMEVKNMIFHWVEIAPEEVGGCQFSVPKTEILLKGQPFREIANHEFQVNKEMLIKLVIGRNLYNSKLDFIREYLQNSLDAVKMKLWLELKDKQNAYYYMDPDVRNQESENVNLIEPFQLRPYVYEKYRIDVICEWDNSKPERPMVSIKIIDSGIGIDEECVDAISHIGSGWNRRRKYRNDLESMPSWLKPTGGFGIGMQSGFMIADVIKIETRCENDITGREIILHSSTTSGKIEEKRTGSERKGTAVEVKIPYEWFLEEKNYNYYGLNPGEGINDYFVENDIMNGVDKIVNGYIKTVASNSLFPIYISRRNFSWNKVGNIFSGNIDSGKTIRVDGKEYKIYHDNSKNIVYIWEKERAILCTVQADKSFQEARLSWSYKGMKVCPEMDRKEIAVAKPFGDVSIDIMGIDVEDCLTVDRSKFNPEFDHFSLALQLMKAYINSFDDISKLFKGDITDKSAENIRQEDCYKFLICERLLENEEQLNLMKDFLDSVQEESVAVMSNRSLVIDKAEIQQDGGTFGVSVTSLPYICKMIWNGDTDGFLFCSKRYDFGKLKEVPDMQQYTGKQVIADKEIYGIMCMQTSETIVLDDTLKIECLHVKKMDMNSNEEKEIVFGNAINGGGKQQIFYTEKYYEKLWVTAIPFMNVQNYQEQVKNNKKMIISPINPSNSSMELLQKELAGKENVEKCFEEYVKKNGNFQYLLDWVQKHQFSPGKYSKQEIEASYTDLIKFIYEREVKNHIVKQI